MDYDEDAVLTRYVWAQCRGYMTDFELAGVMAMLGREKAAGLEPGALREMIVRHWATPKDPDVLAALEQGHDAFQVAVRDRVVRDHPQAIVRCPKCARVLRTPRARQCMWCLHDWHQK